MTNEPYLKTRPVPWWAPPVLMLATALCTAGAVGAARNGDVLLFLFAATGTAFTGLLAWGGLAARRAQKQGR